MVQSDLYIRGSETLRHAIVLMVMGIAERIGVATTGESNLNILLSGKNHEAFQKQHFPGQPICLVYI